ncbi:MAG: ABC transporter permease [Myxococcota bacterium]
MIRGTIALALRELRRNVMRSALTILGVVIGVAAVITIVTLGAGARAKVTADVASLGRNMLVVMPGADRHGGGTSAEPFDPDDVEALARELGDRVVVSPSASQRLLAVHGNENWPTTVSGSDNAYLDIRDWALSSGRRFEPGEERAGRLVCLLGATVREEVFGASDPLGRSLRLGRLSCPVIGVLEARGQSSFGMDQDDLVLVPLRAFHRRIAGNRDVSAVYLSAHDASDTESVQRAVVALLRQRRGVVEGADDDFRVRDLKEIAAVVDRTTSVLTALLGAIAAVSLLVGGIGIMNIMLVSVTERTREIGIRMAIGALEWEVLLQFLAEAVGISLIGGLTGIALGLLGSAAAAAWLDLPFVVQPMVVGVAFVFSGVVGVVFGFFPARKAARLDPIEALRHE